MHTLSEGCKSNYIRMCSVTVDCEQCQCSETNFCTAPPDLRSLEDAEKVVHRCGKSALSVSHLSDERHSVLRALSNSDVYVSTLI